MSEEQRGRYEHGTYGYPLRIRTGVVLLKSVVTEITLVIFQPAGTRITRVLDVNVAIFDEQQGIVEYIFQDGDIPVFGRYTAILFIQSGPNKRIIFQGKFQID